jgi:hypothetical protein
VNSSKMSVEELAIAAEAAWPVGWRVNRPISFVQQVLASVRGLTLSIYSGTDGGFMWVEGRSFGTEPSIVALMGSLRRHVITVTTAPLPDTIQLPEKE